MDELVRLYKQSVLDEETATASINAEIYRMKELAEEAARPYTERMVELYEQIAVVALPHIERQVDLLAEIEPAIIAHGKTYKCDAGTVKLRKGALRVSYDWRKVDTVKAALADLMPNLAAELDKAREESTGKPSFSIE